MPASETSRQLSFGKDQRLLTAADYRGVFEQVTSKRHSKYFTFLCAANQQPFSRLGLVIAKRHVPTAVQRNRIKRQIRETFRLAFPVEGIPGFDIVVLAKPAARQLAKQQIHQELCHQWLKLIAQFQQL